MTGFPHTDAQALEALRPDPAFIEITRDEAARRGDMFSIACQHIAKLRMQLLGQIIDKLRSGELVATSLTPPSPVPISADLWTYLVPIIPVGVAEGGGYKFQNVRVGPPAPPAQLRSAKCRDWMQSLPLESNEMTKKKIQHMAEQALGPDFTVREFNAAYRDVFNRKHGRPRMRRAVKKYK
jgi:hypothetical protein